MLLSPSEEADAAADLFSQLDQTATIYGEAASSGRYTQVLKDYLECRLVPVNTMSPQAQGRAELMAQRDFYWSPAYFMPEHCQIDVEGVRWSPMAGTFQRLRAGDSAALICKCAVIRQQSGSF